ncbi:hypothetical protein P692DRAFT_201801422 [Suillus brevipes Sb2]|nr:hypothetical protein P692DRAFT_201801422 [Suillus brevipes Sb2]
MPVNHNETLQALSMFHSDKLHTFVFCSLAGFADVVGVDDGERPYVLFFCLSWFQKKKKKEVPQPPVYDDELEDDEEEDVPDPAAVPPPRVQHEDIEMKTLASQLQPEAGPSALQQPTT